MRLKKVKNAKDTVNMSHYYVKEPVLIKGKWNTEFKNKNPIHIEIRNGKR